MKTLREIILAQHQAASPILDQARRHAIATELKRPRQLSLGALVAEFASSGWQELFWCWRKIWLGFALVWAALFLLNLNLDGVPRTQRAQYVRPSPEVIALLREQHELLSEIIGQGEVESAEPPRRTTPPRSELPGKTQNA